MEVQTRNQEGALRYFDTVGQAMQAADHDDTIWKISWTDESGERIRLVRRSELKPDGWETLPSSGWSFGVS